MLKFNNNHIDVNGHIEVNIATKKKKITKEITLWKVLEANIMKKMTLW
jgi:hypothetical protein